MLPSLNADGNLPAGIHHTDAEEFLQVFGGSSPRRKWLSERLREVFSLLSLTGHVPNVFVWGSFVTGKDSPNNVDLLLVVDEQFDLEHIPENCKIVFNYVGAKLRFSIDIFWTRSSIGKETLALWLDTYQITRDFKRRGIVEVRL